MVDPEAPAHDGRPLDAIARTLCDTRASELAAWSLDDHAIRTLRTSTALRLLTPSSTVGEPLHVLSALERRTARWDTDREAARDALSAAVSLVLRLLDRDPDPARSREHVLLSVLAERRLTPGRDATLAALLDDLEHPPVTTLGALPLDAFLPRGERRALAAALNALLASPSFASWREGTTLDLAAWLARRPDGRTPAVIVSVAHLDDAERALVLGVLLEELLAWVRSAHQAPTRRADEAAAGVWRRHAARDAEPHGPGLQRPEQRGALVDRGFSGDGIAFPTILHGTPAAHRPRCRMVRKAIPSPDSPQRCCGFVAAPCRPRVSCRTTHQPGSSTALKKPARNRVPHVIEFRSGLRYVVAR